MLAFLLLLALLFDFPSAYAVAAGKPRWVAWTVGVLALLVPLAWNIVGERKRVAAAKPGKPSTTRVERIWLRTGFVALVVIGGLLGMARVKALRAVRHHALWFLPYSPSPLSPTSALLERVPADATTVIWLRDTSAARAALGQFKPVTSGEFEVVLAIGGDKRAIVMERGDLGLIDQVAKLAQFAGRYANVTFAPAYSLPDGTRVFATPGWGVSSSPPTALLDRMRRANDDAFLVGAIDDPAQHVSGVAWIGAHDNLLYGVVEGAVASEAQAKKLVADAEREVGKDPKAVSCWGQSGGEASLTSEGAALHGAASIQVSELIELFVCLDLKK